VHRVILDLTPEQRSAYDAAEQAGRIHLEGLGRSATVLNVLEVITRLKQVCNFCPESGRSAKLDDVRNRLEQIEASGHRALLFSQWKNERYGVRRLAAELAAFHPLVLDGDVALSERSALVDRFERDEQARLLLMSLRAGGQGLNLQCASYVFHFDRWWNPAVENQATDRSHRMGQQNPVTVYAYTCAGTIEERIEQILDEKRQLFSQMVDLVSLDVRRLLSDQELFGLFGLEAPERKRSTASRGVAFEDRVARLFHLSGWSVRATDTGLAASIWDEVGGRRNASIAAVAGRTATGQDLTGVTAPDALGLVVSEKGFSEEALTVATEHGLILWTLQDLERLEAAMAD
jgi:hypothetical protein